MLSLQWQNLRQRNQKIPEHITRQAEALPAEVYWQRQKCITRQKFTSPVPKKNRAWWTGRSHPCVQTQGLLLSLKSFHLFWPLWCDLTLRKNWRGFSSIIDFLLSLSIWTAVVLHFPNIFLRGTLPPKKLILLQILNVGTLEKICWRCLLNWSSLGFTPIVFHCPVPFSFTFGSIWLTYSLCSFETFAVY